RRTSRVLSARPGGGGTRARNVAWYGAWDSACTDSTGSPSTHSSKRETTRVSATYRPCAWAGVMSPPGPHTQNELPSTSVTVCWPVIGAASHGETPRVVVIVQPCHGRSTSAG